MKILVTGGCGYIGSHTVVELLKEGFEVRVIDNLENSNEEVIAKIERITGKKTDFIKGDLRNIEDIEKAMDGVGGIIHFAAYKSVVESEELPLKYFHNNVIGTYNLLSVMEKKGIDKIVFSSSAAVYGNPKNVPITEEEELYPLSVYGRNKYCMELLLKDSIGLGINHVALRYFNAAGAHESGLLGEDPDALGNLIPRVFKASIGEYHLQVRGDKYNTKDGTAIRDYVHVTDLSIGHVKALNWLINNPKESEVFNLCSGEGSTVMEIITLVEKVTGREVDYEIVPPNASEAEIVCGSYNKSEKILKWRPERFIEKIIEDASRWYDNSSSSLS